MREEKKFIVEELVNEIKSANPVIVTDYSRVKANDLNQLRSSLRACGSCYRVVQNTLFKKAVESAGLNRLDEQVSGPLAIAYGGKDVIEVIKALIKFSKDTPDTLVIKNGIVDKEFYEFAALEKLSKLPSRDVLLAQFVGQMNAPLSRFVMVLQGNLQKLVCVLSEIAKKKE